MWFRSNRTAILGTALTALLAGTVDATASDNQILVTPESEAICAKADKRYQGLFPDVAIPNGTVVVKLHKYTFCPPNLTVKSGTTVRWVNVDKRTSHSVWLKESGVEESERFFPDEIWEHTFTEDGAYPYLCGPHWKDDNMRGFVRVTP